MWKKKLKEIKGKNYNYSLRSKLKRDKKITDDFEIMLQTLSIEEVLGLKFDINNKLYNFPVYRSLKYIVKEACLHFALSSTRTFGDAASFLGIRPSELRKEIHKFQIDLSEMKFDKFEEPI